MNKAVLQRLIAIVANHIVLRHITLDHSEHSLKTKAVFIRLSTGSGRTDFTYPLK